MFFYSPIRFRMISAMPTKPHKPPRFDQKVIAARIRAERKRHGLSAEDLAEQAKIGVESLYKKERGEQPFYMDEITRICDVLETPSLFPFLDLDAARLADKLLGRD
jgi:transcriptional regulator with XRE-family HTH domain